MPKTDPDQPPADVLPLEEAFWRFTDPQLLETLRRLEAAGANVPPRVIYSPYRSTTNPLWGEYQRARRVAEADFRRHLLSGDELLSWGSDTPWGPLHAIRPDAWSSLAVVNWKGGIVRGPKPAATRLYGVVVARRAEAPGRRPKDEDAPALDEMDRILNADPTLSDRDHRAIAGQLIDDGWVDLDGAERESVIRRLVKGLRCRKFSA